MAGPGLVATVLVGLASPRLTTPGTSWAASAGLCLIIPVLVAITITGMTPDGNLPDTTRWRRATRLGLGLGLVLVAPIMVLPLLALVVGRAVNAWGTTAPQPGGHRGATRPSGGDAVARPTGGRHRPRRRGGPGGRRREPCVRHPCRRGGASVPAPPDPDPGPGSSASSPGPTTPDPATLQLLSIFEADRPVLLGDEPVELRRTVRSTTSPASQGPARRDGASW